MQLDFYSIKKVVEEITPLITGGRINRINQPTSGEVVLTIYTNKTLKIVLSTEAKYSRICLTNEEKENPKVAPNFCMLLRKHILGGQIKNVEIVNNDRIVKITIENLSDFKEVFTRDIYIELMGKYSNIFLVSNGTILGALKIPPQDFEGKRLIISGIKYILPEKKERLSLEDKTSCIEALNNITEPLSTYLLSIFGDFSPITAREIEFRVKQRNLTTGEEIYVEILSFMNENNPTSIVEGDYITPFPTDYLSITGERKHFDSFLKCIDYSVTYSENKEEFLKKKNGLISKIHIYEKRELKKLKLIDEKEKNCQDLEKLRHYGELIVAYMYLVKKGAKEVTCFDYENNGKEITIPLDENLSPSQNAQRYFKRYNKEKKTLEVLTKQREETLKELEYINSVYFELDEVKDIKDFDEIYDELVMQEVITEQSSGKKKGEIRANHMTFKVDQYIIKVGKTNIQNDNLTFSSSKNCMWLHTKTYHSAHVIIDSVDGKVPERIIFIAAEICGYYSSGRRENKIDVDYTLKKFVKRNPNGKIGNVIYTDYSTIRVSPDSHDEFKL